MTTYIAGDNMITSLGFSTRENMDQLKAGISGLKKQTLKHHVDFTGYYSLVDNDRLDQIFSDVADRAEYTRLERLAITSVRYAVEKTDIDLTSPKTLFILSTTKGNIDLLGVEKRQFPQDRIKLWVTARIITSFFANPEPPLVVSNACISGVTALLVGHRLLQMGRYKNIVVVGVDLTTPFVISGFQSFKSLSDKACKPYDKKRDGLNLGEGAGTLILTSDPNLATPDKIVIRSGASAGDANHISGPSPEGAGLLTVIEKILKSTAHSRQKIDFTCPHGTATRYNDDMEAVALHRSKLNKVPVVGLKGYFGHTLGAAGVLETVSSIHCLQENLLLKTKGYSSKGTVKEINVVKKPQTLQLNHCLKLASGFGGCNAGILISKHGTY